MLELILIITKRSFPLNKTIINEEYYANIIDENGNIQIKNLSELINILKNSKEEICLTLNIQDITEFCKHINLPYETLGQIYPMFLTIVDLYSKEFIGLTSNLYKNLQNISRFCSYNTDKILVNITSKRNSEFIDNFISLLETSLSLSLRIDYKLANYRKYTEL